MKAPFSEYLNQQAPGLKKLVEILNEKFDYVSALSTDCTGLVVQISRSAKAVSGQTMASERGTVLRVMKNGLYSEYAMNDFDGTAIEAEAEKIIHVLEQQFELLKETGTKVYSTEVLEDEPCTLFVEKEAEQLPESADVKKLVENLTAIHERALAKDPRILECMVTAQSTHVCKMFLSAHRDLRQSYVFSEGTIVPVACGEGLTRHWYYGVSGLKGPELFETMGQGLDNAVDVALELLGAEPVVPGEYEVICSPEVSGLIAHEAFGHGAEMDMFVKDRALGKEYINKRVGSDAVTMSEGALCAEDVTTYAFDDEGVLAGAVTEIDHGIFKTGICDALAAKRLGCAPTGNGKRQSYDHKVYTRMTNTIFEPGEATLQEMISSIKYGYLLEGMHSGMEDPKHWGIQCIVAMGREIVDGKLTGKIVTPVVMTGYVPDLLGNVTMCSKDREVFGNGGCGKGHKEWVKVADGGPYMKTKARLG